LKKQHVMKAKLNDVWRALAKAPLEVGVAVCALAALLWVFWPTLVEMASRWGSESQYSHGYLVPVFSVFLLWSRRRMLPKKPGRAVLWGIGLLLAGLGLRFYADYVYFDWLSAVSLLPCLAGVCLVTGGWQALRWAWPAIGFLVFMVPLPYQVETALAVPLRGVATRGSTYVLQTVGFAAFAEGNVIRMGDIRIGVEEACSGLSMLLIFFALSTAVVLLANCSVLEKGMIIVSAVPIALIANIARIAVTGILFRTVGGDFAEWFHSSALAGFLVMFLGLGLLWIELRLFAWILVVPPTREQAQAPIALGAVGRDRSDKAASPSRKPKTGKKKAAFVKAAPPPGKSESAPGESPGAKLGEVTNGRCP